MPFSSGFLPHPYLKGMPMSSKIFLLSMAISGLGLAAAASGGPPPVTAQKPATAARVEALLKQMTLEEKVGQMGQITLDVIGGGADRYSSPEPFAIDSSKLFLA